jgi:hypothetical protein
LKKQKFCNATVYSLFLKQKIFLYLCSGLKHYLLKLQNLPMKQFLLFIAVGVLFSCQTNDVGTPTQIMGLAPVYAPLGASNTVAIEPIKATKNPGKIYAYGNYLFQVEQYEGIHIIDNSNSSQARKVAFLKVPMASEIAIKSDHLYTNNVNDLVVFSLSTITAPQLVSRIANAFPVIDQTHPNESGYFECPDPSKGVVIAWERKMLDQPKCRR